MNSLSLISNNLKVHSDGTAKLMFIGDIHKGHENCNEKLTLQAINYCAENNINVILMGDLIEVGTKHSVGDSVYTQKYNPHQQKDSIINDFRVLSDKKLIELSITGNHCLRISKDSGIDIAKDIAKELNTSYGGFGCYYYATVGNQNYVMYVTHGYSSAQDQESKRKSIKKLATFVDADVYAMGHVHMRDFFTENYQRVNKRNRSVEYYNRYFVLTGHSLFYEDSYAQGMAMKPNEPGFIQLNLHSDKKLVTANLWPFEMKQFNKRKR